MKNPEDCKLLGLHDECLALRLHQTDTILGISQECIACQQTLSTGEFILACLSFPLEVYIFLRTN